MILQKFIGKIYSIALEILMWIIPIAGFVAAGILLGGFRGFSFGHALLGLIVGFTFDIIMFGPMIIIFNMRTSLINIENGNNASKLTSLNEDKIVSKVNPLLISVIIGGLILLIAFINPRFIGNLRNFMIIMPLLFGFLGLILNIISLVKVNKIFSLITGILFSISALFIVILIIINIIRFGVFRTNIFYTMFFFFVPAIICFMDYFKKYKES